MNSIRSRAAFGLLCVAVGVVVAQTLQSRPQEAHIVNLPAATTLADPAEPEMTTPILNVTLTDDPIDPDNEFAQGADPNSPLIPED